VNNKFVFRTIKILLICKNVNCGSAYSLNASFLPSQQVSETVFTCTEKSLKMNIAGFDFMGLNVFSLPEIYRSLPMLNDVRKSPDPPSISPPHT
jgi:hypothetical protein